MKTAFILFFILVILGLNAEAGAPYGIKGQEQSTLYSNVHQFANKQVTNLGGINALVQDCGSSANLFENCGYEAGPTSTTTITGWTLTAGTMVAETTDVKQGKKSLKLEMTSDALDFYQTSTLNATAFADGVNGSISLAIKTTVDNVYLCRTDSAGAVVASTDGTKITNCVKISNSGKWGDYVMPIILGATSNGMRLVSLTPSTAAAVAVTGDVYVDAGILEAGLKATSQGVCTTADCETIFSARINGATGAITSTSQTGWLTSTRTGTGQYTLSWSSLGLAVIPNIKLRCETDIYNAYSFGNATTGIGTVVRKSDVPGTLADCDMSVELTKLGIDFTNAKALASGRFYTVPSDSFSTDSNTLAHKTTAIASTDPIGTYNTYSYAINTNNKTICGSAPSILPNAADGFKIFTRAYNAASTCGNPARVEIKIGAAGTKFPTIKTDIYKSAAKVTAGDANGKFYNSGATAGYGIAFNSYDEATGILILDTAPQEASVTVAVILYNDGTSQASGFLVINAQKMKDSIVGSFAGLQTIAARATQNNAQSIPNATATKMIFNAESYDYGSNLDIGAGRFTAPVEGVYKVSGASYWNNAVTGGSISILAIYKNGGVYSWGSLALRSPNEFLATVSDDVYLARGDYVELFAYQADGAARTLAADATRNHFSISRVGAGTP